MIWSKLAIELLVVQASLTQFVRKDDQNGPSKTKCQDHESPVEYLKQAPLIVLKNRHLANTLQLIQT
jgi:hypothetical protein